MQRYIGTKIIHAEPESRPMSDGSNGEVDGYKVVYPDGYTSWSPKATFEEAYRPVDGVSFSLALEALKKGHRASRAGWNTTQTWLAHQTDSEGDAYIAVVSYAEGVDQKTSLPRIYTWEGDHDDILADDWQILD